MKGRCVRGFRARTERSIGPSETDLKEGKAPHRPMRAGVSGSAGASGAARRESATVTRSSQVRPSCTLIYRKSAGSHVAFRAVSAVREGNSLGNFALGDDRLADRGARLRARPLPASRSRAEAPLRLMVP